GVGLETVVAFILGLGRSAITATSIRENNDLVTSQGIGREGLLSSSPGVFRPLEPVVAPIAVEALGDRVLADGILRAVHAAASEQRRKLRDPDPEYLFRENVIDPLFEVGDLRRQPVRQTPSNLTEKDTRLRKRVEER